MKNVANKIGASCVTHALMVGVGVLVLAGACPASPKDCRGRFIYASISEETLGLRHHLRQFARIYRVRLVAVFHGETFRRNGRVQAKAERAIVRVNETGVVSAIEKLCSDFPGYTVRDLQVEGDMRGSQLYRVSCRNSCFLSGNSRNLRPRYGP